MNSFEEIQANWDKQAQINPPKNGFESLIKKIDKIRSRQKITNVVLLTTCLVLAGFFFYISGYKNNEVSLGLSLMIGSLIIRVVIEVLSINKLKKLNLSVNNKVFKDTLVKYYNQRRIVHLIITPIIVLVYSIGFIILLPAFKANLSLGFYNYIVISSIVLLFVFGIFIGKQIKNELMSLKVLKDQE